MSRQDPYEALAGELEAAASFVRAKGAAIEQRFYEWQKLAGIPPAPAPCPACGEEGDPGCEVCHGSGCAPSLGPSDGREQADASRQLHRWRLAVADLVVKVQRVRGFGPVAFPAQARLEAKHLTAAQVEADGWCGSCWRVGAFTPIATRPSGEPWYRGRCRPCGEWPKGDPPLEVVKARKDGRSIRVAAS